MSEKPLFTVNLDGETYHESDPVQEVLRFEKKLRQVSAYLRVRGMFAEQDAIAIEANDEKVSMSLATQLMGRKHELDEEAWLMDGLAETLEVLTEWLGNARADAATRQILAPKAKA